MLSRWEQRELLMYMRALAEENRLLVLANLQNGERSAGEIAAALDISEPTVSHHLSTLREAGLISLRSQGNQRFYAQNPTKIARFKRLTAQIDSLDATPVAVDDQGWIDALDVSEEDRKVFRDYFFQGRITRFPSRQKKQLVILRWLAKRFEAGVIYTEKDINAIIQQVHDDTNTVRRDLVDFGFLRRALDGSKYWKAES